MKARHLVFMVLLIGLFSGCSEKLVDNSATARVKISARPSSSEAAGQFKYFTLVVTGPGIPRPIAGVLLQVDGTLEGEVEVPVGRSRRFIARGYSDKDEVIYSGQVVVDITGDMSSADPVVIVLYPQVALMKFAPRSVDVEMFRSFGVDARIFKVDSVETITFRVIFDRSVLRADSALLHPDLLELPGNSALSALIVDSYPESYIEISISNISDTGTVIIVDSAGHADLTKVYFTAMGSESGAELGLLPITINDVDVSENDLVTEKCAVQVGPMLQDVVANITDSGLEGAIRDRLNKPAGDLYASELQTIDVLDASRRGIVYLEGIEYCTNLVNLDLFGNNINRIGPLASLPSLGRLDLTLNMISDLRPLAGLTDLGQLWLGGNLIDDITPLADLTALQYLGLYNNQISDIAPLAGMTALVWLELQGNDIGELGPLTDLTNMQNLYISSNRGISNIGPLANMTALRELSSSGNSISDISPLAGLTGLRQLYLQRNQINNLSPLASLTELRNLMLGWNQFSDISPLASLTMLSELNIESSHITDIGPLTNLTGLYQLRLSENQISDLDPLSNMSNLLVLRLDNNQVRNVGSLAGLLNLQYLYLGFNQISDIGPLSTLADLDRLDLYSNVISDVCPLIDNAGIGAGDTLDFRINPLSDISISECIPALQSRGVTVLY